jgi:hypothetical protein
MGGVQTNNKLDSLKEDIRDINKITTDKLFTEKTGIRLNFEFCQELSFFDCLTSKFIQVKVELF